jgi:Ca2+-binding EF-hand superfamily protein
VAPWADRLFTRLDANQDGSITGDEMATLTRPEVASRGGSRLRGLISQSDANRDARVSREELTAGAGRMFTRMDSNGDGRLADEELPQPPAPPRPMAIPMPAPAPMPMPMPPEPSGG